MFLNFTRTDLIVLSMSLVGVSSQAGFLFRVEPPSGRTLGYASYSFERAALDAFAVRSVQAHLAASVRLLKAVFDNVCERRGVGVVP